MSQFPSTGSKPQPEGSTRLVIIALVMALLAVILVNVYVSFAKTRAAGGSLIIYRATRALNPGDRLTDKDLEAVEVPDRFQQTYTNVIKRDQTGRADRLGDEIKRPIAHNEFITYGHFVEDPERSLSGKITPGKRLVALPVKSDILPSIGTGMRVDIAAPFIGAGAAPDVLLVIENVEIRSVGQFTEIDEQASDGRRRAPTSFKTITIEVLPQQALQLSRIEKIAAGPFELHIRPEGGDSTPLIRGGGINPAVLEKIGDAPSAVGGL